MNLGSYEKVAVWDGFHVICAAPVAVLVSASIPNFDQLQLSAGSLDLNNLVLEGLKVFDVDSRDIPFIVERGRHRFKLHEGVFSVVVGRRCTNFPVGGAGDTGHGIRD